MKKGLQIQKFDPKEDSYADEIIVEESPSPEQSQPFHSNFVVIEKRRRRATESFSYL